MPCLCAVRSSPVVCTNRGILATSVKKRQILKLRCGHIAIRARSMSNDSGAGARWSRSHTLRNSLFVKSFATLESVAVSSSFVPTVTATIDTAAQTAASFPVLSNAALPVADTARVRKGGTTGATGNEHTAGARLTSPAPRLKKPLWIRLQIRHSLPASSPRHPSPRCSWLHGGRFSPNPDESSAISVDGSGVFSILLLNLGEI